MEGSRAVEGTKEMLLSWFRDDELDVCPRCHQNEVLRQWVRRQAASALLAAWFRWRRRSRSP